ncbi:hypothetical protein RUESEDTHA_03742 [Ruegeria sp. THAF57]|uniref:DUF7714 family protein n=1 Tax=Ruegeria sp. THAF57 TaxID=2744555 RepID=UPI0015DDECEC|nr:hypothetical protein [Ruegeria sp. THAF57]CAD0186831.1 hypothetical protein RUESEDTHA_03742 [Ruegeria sp. THAF57]
MFDFDASARNIVPNRYRQVALSTDLTSLDPDWLIAHFTGREAYMRTRFIVARKGQETTLLEVDRENDTDLFSPITAVRVLAEPQDCLYVTDNWADAGIPSHLAAVADRHPGFRCVVIEGRYSHVSFILNPDPIRLHVLDIVPPFPSKLVDQVTRVLDGAEDLPPIVVVPVLTDSREVLADERNPVPQQLLVPCRGSGIDVDNISVSYLDERPAEKDWVLLGCERSDQIHNWFYKKPPDLVDTCPRKFLPQLSQSDGPVLTRCCLLQEGIEDRADAVFVPWGASLDEVRDAIELIVEQTGVAWSHI